MRNLIGAALLALTTAVPAAAILETSDPFLFQAEIRTDTWTWLDFYEDKTRGGVGRYYQDDGLRFWRASFRVDGMEFVQDGHGIRAGSTVIIRTDDRPAVGILIKSGSSSYLQATLQRRVGKRWVNVHTPSFTWLPGWSGTVTDEPFSRIVIRAAPNPHTGERRVHIDSIRLAYHYAEEALAEISGCADSSATSVTLTQGSVRTAGDLGADGCYTFIGAQSGEYVIEVGGEVP